MLVHGQSSEPATVPVDGPGRTLSLVGSGRIVSKFHYADPTGPDPRASWLSDKSADSGRRLVRSMSTCTDFVRGSGRVGSGRRQSPWVRAAETDTDQIVGDVVAGADMSVRVRSGSVRVAEFRNDTARSDRRQSPVGPA